MRRPMRNRFLLPLSVLLIALVSASVSAVEAPSARSGAPTSTSVGRTYIYPTGSHRWFSINCLPFSGLGDLLCNAMWFDPNLGYWAVRLSPRKWGSGTESPRAEHLEAYARRRTLRLWDVPAYGATIHFHSRGRWDVYNARGRLVACTRGPQGVAAGFLWLGTVP